MYVYKNNKLGHFSVVLSISLESNRIMVHTTTPFISTSNIFSWGIGPMPLHCTPSGSAQSGIRTNAYKCSWILFPLLGSKQRLPNYLIFVSMTKSVVESVHYHVGTFSNSILFSTLFVKRTPIAAAVNSKRGIVIFLTGETLLLACTNWTVMCQLDSPLKKLIFWHCFKEN